ncbi:MAG: hypothetical protein SFX73_08780 [Kofleriaceae bacterium]|nr:hypothetical protein [Kofleriaceae bacterium]
MSGTIATSLDGQWVTIRRERQLVILAGGALPVVGQLELDRDDTDVALVGPPTAVAIVSRTEPKVTLYQPPYLDAVARHDLEQPMRLAAVTGQRLALLSTDHKSVVIVRGAGRALSAAPIDPGGAVEFAVGLERNQLLLGLARKLEVWDAVSGRPLLRLQLQLPPPPRTVGAAHGHLWVTRPGSDEVFVYRLSDGRPFRHYVGSPIEDVICHPASPLIVLVTPRGLVRLHCFAHSLTVVDSPYTPGMPLAQLVVNEDISLLGLADGSAEPWRVPIAGTGAPVPSGEATESLEAPVLTTAADKLRAMRERAAGNYDGDAPALSSSPSAPTFSIAHASTSVATPAITRARAWREPLATYGLELTRGLDSEAPVLAVDTELGELAHRLALPAPARRALIALYALYLVGEPALSVARLAQALGDWTEPLGQGELNALAMLRRHNGRVSLRSSVTDLLDGIAPRAIRVVGGAAQSPRAGILRLARDGRSDAAIEIELAGALGRIGIIEGATTLGILEARLHGATAVALAAPSARPAPWPRDASLVVVADAAAPAWVSALPAF